MTVVDVEDVVVDFVVNVDLHLIFCKNWVSNS